MTKFPQFQTSERFLRVFPILESALENELIYNVDFKFTKDYLSLAFEEILKEDHMAFAGNVHNADHEMYWASTSSFHHAKSGLKKIKAITAFSQRKSRMLTT